VAERDNENKLYKLVEFQEPKGTSTASSATCKFCGKVFYGSGGGGMFICLKCLDELYKLIYGQGKVTNNAR
jgi:hypothetical protein